MKKQYIYIVGVQTDTWNEIIKIYSSEDEAEAELRRLRRDIFFTGTMGNVGYKEFYVLEKELIKEED